uniref:probable prolyl 4-hydroxylase 10 n=1 Tax=Erigeron canadensis TaxID=72917 RepID=UPI001CB95C25|nr:probable prolyl 4-hydroxylase 10 [Erigeron canadensis]
MQTLCLFFTLILLAHGVHPIPSKFTTDHVPNSIVQNDTDAARSDGCSDGLDHSVEVISWEPRVVIYHNFLSKKECEYLINVAKPHMRRSTITDLVTRETYEDTWFSPCSLTMLDRGQDETIRAIEKKIADFTFLPVENGEGLQVIHYEVGDKYPLHNDLYLDDYQTGKRGKRMATVLMYLSDTEDGGETAFPSAMGKYDDVHRWAFEYSECNKSVLYAKPKMGDALLLWNVKPDGTSEYSSEYAECPVIKGNKWTATKWIRSKEYYEK